MKFRLTGKFGELSPVRNMQPHSGIDLAMPEGTTLRSVADGVVDRVFDGTGLIGKGLSVKFPDGTRAIYGHMNEVKEHVGDKVNAGDIVGLSGNTGNSTGPHLHFGLKDANGSVLDPTPIADKLANISGDHLGPIGKVIAIGTESVREKAADMTVEIALGIFDALKDFLLAGTLIGAALLILLKVAGWRDGGRWAGVLLVVNILLKFLFGVY
jgi:murein DD-endopeptidase MepM/ murein hydrolase activator NlpD